MSPETSGIKTNSKPRDSNRSNDTKVGQEFDGRTGGQLTAEFLRAWGIPYVFGLAGSEEVGFIDALIDCRDIQYITCLHENVAMAMADGFSRSTGCTSFVQLHSVAGTAYALGQIVNSFRDRIPVVIAAGRQSSDFRGHDGFLEAANLHTLPRDYCQWIWDVMNAETVPDTMRRAFLLAEAPPGGPVFLTFSKDFWEQNANHAEVIPRDRSVIEYDVAPSVEHVAAIADALINADMPALYIGNEAIRWDIADEVAAIAELTGAAVMTAAKVPVLFPTTHPNYVGEFLDDPSLVERIDVFWSLGGHLFKTIKRAKKSPVRHMACVMHTGLNASEVGRNYPVDRAAVASVSATAKAVLHRLQKINIDSDRVADRNSWLNNKAHERRSALAAVAKDEWDAKPIATSRLMLEINDVAGTDAYFVTEIVSSDQYLRNYLDIDHTSSRAERRRNYDTTGGVLGWGVAAAIGVKLGNPDREVWCLTGDGSFNFSPQSLWSVARYRIPIAIVIFNNGQFQSNRRFLHFYGGRAAETGRYPGVQLGDPDIDYPALATAYGVEGESVDDPASLKQALSRARAAIMDEKRPYLVDVKIERRYGGAESSWMESADFRERSSHD